MDIKTKRRIWGAETKNPYTREHLHFILGASLMNPDWKQQVLIKISHLDS